MNISFSMAGVASGKETINQIVSNFEDAAAPMSKQAKKVATSLVSYVAQTHPGTDSLFYSTELIGTTGSLVACIALIAGAESMFRAYLPH